MATPDKLFGVEKEGWFEWESLRRSGVMNMWGAGEVLGLSREEFSAIIKHYVEMRDAWEEEYNTRFVTT